MIKIFKVSCFAIFMSIASTNALAGAKVEALIGEISQGMAREEVEAILGSAWQESLAIAFNSSEVITYRHRDFSDPQIRVHYRWRKWRVISVSAGAPDQIFPGIGVEVTGPLTVIADPILVHNERQQNKPEVGNGENVSGEERAP